MKVTDKKVHALMRFHGLDPEAATDGDVDEALKNALSSDDINELENRAEAGDKAREALADAELKRFANRIGNDDKAKKFWRDGLLTNRDETIAALEALPEKTVTPAPRTPVHNRSNAANPNPVDAGGASAADQKKQQVLATRISNRAKEIQNGGGKDAHGRPLVHYGTAFNKAQVEVLAEQEGK